MPSSWRSSGDLDGFLRRGGVPGIHGIDTRALTRRLRSSGIMRACIAMEGLTDEQAIKLAKEVPYEGVDFVQEVTTPQPYDWDVQNSLSRKWILSKSELSAETQSDETGNVFKPLPPVLHRIVAYDFGLKRNILRSLRRKGFAVKVVPATMPAGEVLSMNPEGVFLSNGRDPATLLRSRNNPRIDWKAAAIRHLSRPPTSRSRAGRQDLQAQIRTSRSESAGQGSSHRKNSHYLSEPWVCGRSRFLAGKRRGHPRQPQRWDSGGTASPAAFGLQRSIPSRSIPRSSRCFLLFR